MDHISTQMMPNANNITVTSELSYCDPATWNLNQTISDLRNLYQGNVSDLISNVFLNISIMNFNCTNGMKNYFQQIITFTQAVSIRIQILFASIYFDYINANNYRLNGLIINQETFINLSSITVNNIDTTNACSSGEVAQDSLCRMNLTHPVCTILSNPWSYTCSQQNRTTATSLLESTSLVETTVTPPHLNSWQLGLICGLSVLFVLLVAFLSGFFYRRYRHSKQLALSRVSLYDDVKIMQKNGIPQGQAFQRSKTVVQPQRITLTATSWVHDRITTNIVPKDENCIHLKPPEPFNQVTFVDHAKVHDPNIPATIPEKAIRSVHIPTSPSNITSPMNGSRPVSGTSTSQLKLITDGLQEDKLNECDNISLDQPSPKKLSSPASKQFTNLSFIDENLTEEDAWMSILDIVNVELAKLNDQDRIKTLM